MSKLQLSIIIPTLNEEKFLPKLLDSLTNQTFQDFEVLVIDGKSEDKTKQAAERYMRKLNLRVVDCERGIAKQRNKGAELAICERLLFLDADTMLRPQFLLNALGEIEARKLKGATVWEKPISGRRRDRLGFRLASTIIFLAQALYPIGPGACLFSTKTLHSTIGGFDSTICLGEDCEYVRQIAKYGKFRMLRGELFRVSPRRIRAEGFLLMLTKYMTAIAQTIFTGPIRTDLYNYKFGDFSEYADQETKKKYSKGK